MTSLDYILSTYWSGPVLHASLRLLYDLLGALALGALVGYERFYHGHAAGMRTYGVVCMASAALVAVLGHPDVWFGAHVVNAATAVAPDPTRVIQGIVTGIGFLGAGVIVHEQYSTHGLTTAASIWASSAIGILMGLGLYPAAIGLALLSSACMALGSKIENRLPSQEGIAVVLEFQQDGIPDAAALRRLVAEHGYGIAQRSLSVIRRDQKNEWHFIAIVLERSEEEPLARLAAQLQAMPNVAGFQLAHARG
jgi:putative Mg2+ transporter-C (MgtC) family protein